MAAVRDGSLTRCRESVNPVTAYRLRAAKCSSRRSSQDGERASRVRVQNPQVSNVHLYSSRRSVGRVNDQDHQRSRSRDVFSSHVRKRANKKGQPLAPKMRKARDARDRQVTRSR